MNDCIFCKIANKEIPSEIIWEDENFVAILDINPITRGMTVILPKEHYTSKVFDVPPEIRKEIMDRGKIVSETLEEKLGCERVIAVFEGLEVDHLHLKLYPSYGGMGLLYMIQNPIDKPSGEELKILGEKIRN